MPEQPTTAFNQDYWNRQFVENKTGWDIGYAAPAIVDYINQLPDKNLRILVPGAGSAYEVEYLHQQGFENTYLLDFAQAAITAFRQRVPRFPAEHIVQQDFFEHTGQYDLILEQTFFTSFVPALRTRLIAHLHELLAPQGKWAGLLFTHEFNRPVPPFGACFDTYKALFTPYFNFKTFEPACNSIKPRRGREYFFILQKK